MNEQRTEARCNGWVWRITLQPALSVVALWVRSRIYARLTSDALTTSESNFQLFHRVTSVIVHSRFHLNFLFVSLSMGALHFWRMDVHFRTRSTRSSVDSGAPRSYFGDDGFCIDGIDTSSLYGSQYSFCSCSHCGDQPHDKKNPLYGRTDLRLSICER